MKKVQFFTTDIDNKSEEIKSPLGIKIRFDDKHYRICENNTGELCLYSTEKMQLILKTKSGNLVEIDSEN